MTKKALKIKNRILKSVKLCAGITFAISVFFLDSKTWLPTVASLISGAVYLLIDFGTFLLKEDKLKQKAVHEYVLD